MNGQELFQLKNSNLMKAIHRQGPDFVPNIVGSSCAQVAYTGQRVVDVINDPEAYFKAMTDVYNVMWVDGSSFVGTLFNDGIEKIISPVQNFFGPDGTTPEHVQIPYMEADEYDQLAADPYAFVANVLLPRKYPKLFEDREYAKDVLKKIAENKAYTFATLFPGTTKIMAEQYGITALGDFSKVFMNPFDCIFDYFRGFKGSLIDMRRQPEKVAAACESIWNTFNRGTFQAPVSDFPYPCHMTHIAPYLNPDKFMKLYWPYEKQWIDYVANGGGKVWIMMEGSWARIWDCFKEVPKDCCILHVDDDDIVKAKEEIGGHQIIEGGFKLVATQRSSKEELHAEVRRIIDACAPGDGFLFCTDKSWLSPADMNENLIDVYNYAHEYSQSRTR